MCAHVVISFVFFGVDCVDTVTDEAKKYGPQRTVSV